VVDQDAPGLEAHFIRMKEAVAGQLTRFSLVGAIADNLHQKQWESRRNAALAALEEAALKACLKDADLKARLLVISTARPRRSVSQGRGVLPGPRRRPEARPQQRPQPCPLKPPTRPPGLQKTSAATCANTSRATARRCAS